MALPPGVGRMALATATVAFLVRLAFLLLAPGLGLDTDFVATDTPRYLGGATALLEGRGLWVDGQWSAFVGPGYPLLLAALFALFGQSTVVIGVAQAALGAATAGLVALLAARLGGGWAGWVAGLGVAVYPHLVFWTGHVLTETLFVLLATATLWLLVEGQARGRWGWFAWAGLVLALGVLTRSVLLAFLPAVVAVAWWQASGADRWRAPAAVLLTATVALAPWSVRNGLLMGMPLPVESKAAAVVRQGNSPGATGGTRGYVDPRDYAPLGARRDAGEADWAAAHARAVVEHLAAEPLSVLARLPARVWNMWRPVYEDASPRNWIVVGGSYLATLALAVVGALALRGSSTPPAARQGGAYVLAYLAALFLLHAMTSGMIRFRLPLEPALLVLAGVGAERLRRLLGGRRRLGRPLAQPA